MHIHTINVIRGAWCLWLVSELSFSNYGLMEQFITCSGHLGVLKNGDCVAAACRECSAEIHGEPQPHNHHFFAITI